MTSTTITTINLNEYVVGWFMVNATIASCKGRAAKPTQQIPMPILKLKNLYGGIALI
jgi:hypothetical protein